MIKFDNNEYCNFRLGDVRHFLVDISKAKDLLGFVVEFSLENGIGRSAG
jgi:nucleoside-diphosphate-sugar epimerase